MFAMELYRKYLYSSISYISNSDKAKKLNSEKNKMTDILNGLNDLFYHDPALTNKDDCSIYTLIKKEILTDVLKGNSDAVVLSCRFFLQEIINEIDALQVQMAA